MAKTISTLTSSAAGSVDLGDIIVSGGTLVEAGSASGTVISSGGVLSLITTPPAAAAAGFGTMVMNGGTEVISGGATDTGAVVQAGGTLTLQSGGTAKDAVVSIGGTLIEYSGAQFVSGVVDGGGALTLTSAGTTYSGATIILYSGALMENQVISTGISLILSGGTEIGDVVDNGGSIIDAGGVASLTTVLAGGTLDVIRGEADASTVDAGAIETVSGGIASQSDVSGYLLVVSGAFSLNATVASGGVMVVSSGHALNTDVAGTEQIFNGTSIDNTISGGALFNADTATVTNLTVSAGGSYFLGQSDVFNSLTINAGASGYLGEGNVFNNLSVGSGVDIQAYEVLEVSGTQTIAQGSFIRDTISAHVTAFVGNNAEFIGEVASGGSVVLAPDPALAASGGIGGIQIFDGSIDSGAVVDIIGMSGGSAAAVYSYLSAGGTLSLIGSGAYASLVFVSGTMIVGSGAGADPFEVASGADVLVQPGGSVIVEPATPFYTLSAASGANVFLTSGALVNEATIDNATNILGGVGYTVSGGSLTMLGTSPLSGSIVGSGITIGLNASGLAADLVVGAGARLNLSSGANGSQLSISGGTLLLSAGAVVNSGIIFDAPDGELVIGGSETAVISGFGNGQAETILLSNLAFVPGATARNTGSGLIVTNGGSSVSLNIAGLSSSANVQLTASAGIVALTACYAAGTRIATARGEVAIEHITVGERLLLAGGGSAPVVWTGRRTLDLTRHPEPASVQPVRILAGALAPGRPARDLVISPRHALCIDGALFEAISLVNGATIVQEHAARRVTYYHLELPAHDVIIAEGQPAESYVDRGNRHMFEGQESLLLHPRPDAGAGLAETCLPVHRDGAMLADLRLRLVERALSMGFMIGEAATLEVMAGARRLRPLRAGLYALPPALSAVMLVSAPFYAGEATSTIIDRRRLGVPLRAARLLCGGTGISIDLAAAGHQGLYPPVGGTVWTDGAATLALPAYPGTAMLQLDLAEAPPRLWRAAAI